jgi:hypothetical protein
MWHLLKRSDRECNKAQAELEEAALRRSNARIAQELIEEVTAAEREHIVACRRCRGAAENLAAAREIFHGVGRAAEPDRPFFASRVMAAIAAKERELAELITPWTEVPRFATKLAWITALVLLAGTTWFYEKSTTEPPRPGNGDAGQESIFETQPPASQDDVLMSMTEAPR